MDWRIIYQLVADFVAEDYCSVAFCVECIRSWFPGNSLHACLKELMAFLFFLQGDQVKFPSPDVCVYPRSPALGLGLTAAVTLMIAQVIVNVATGCICCRRGPHQANSNWKLALVCFIVSW